MDIRFPRLLAAACLAFTALHGARAGAASSALRFDGQDDWVDVGPFGHVLGEFTIEAWVRKWRETDYYFDTIVSTDQFRFQIERDEHLEFWYRGRGESFDGRTVPTDNEWHHVAVTWAGGDLVFYLDGLTNRALQGSNEEMVISELRIGHDGLSRLGSDDAFDGDLDEVRFWNRARTPGEIQAFMSQRLSGSEAGLIGYWRLDEAGGQHASDSSPSGAHGTLGSSPDADARDPQWIPSDVRNNVQVDPGCGYAPLEVQFSLAVSSELESVEWDFGDGETSLELSPVHIYAAAGVYRPRVAFRTLSGEEGSREAGTVEVQDDPPRAAFNIDAPRGLLPVEVRFQDTSAGGVERRIWDFGDGTTSSEANPVHTYTSTGTFRVVLTTLGACPSAPQGVSSAEQDLVAKDFTGVELIYRKPDSVIVLLTTETALRGGELGLAYDSSILEVRSIRPGSGFPETAQSFQTEPENRCGASLGGGIGLGWFSPPGSYLGRGRYELLEIRFRRRPGVEPGACSPLRFVRCLGVPEAPLQNAVTDIDLRTLDLETFDAEICVLPDLAYVRGDANGDARNDISDPIAILGCLFLGESCSTCSEASDANDDGAVQISDPIYLLNWRFGSGVSPPSPFPDCGTDPTGDELECRRFDACAE